MTFFRCGDDPRRPVQGGEETEQLHRPRRLSAQGWPRKVSFFHALHIILELCGKKSLYVAWFSPPNCLRHGGHATEGSLELTFPNESLYLTLFSLRTCDWPRQRGLHPERGRAAPARRQVLLPLVSGYELAVAGKSTSFLKRAARSPLLIAIHA